MLKKLILAATGLALSAPVLADHRHRGYGVSQYRHVQQRPVVVHHYYRPAPRPVYVVRHAPPPPPPVVVHHHSRSNAGPALVFGAVLGAAVVHSVMTGR
jgi:hypothetical protein